jgi:hypothetical protein
MYMRKIAAAAGFACGAALAFTPFASADTSTAWWSSIDSLLAGASPAETVPAVNMAISFDGISLMQEGNATATTLPGQFGLAIASGDHATAYAAGGFGDSALASGTYSLAEAGSKTAGANDFNFNSATDIGNNVNPSTYVGAPDGAYAGGASLIGGTDAATASSNNTAQFIGNAGVSPLTGPYADDFNGGNSGAFAGDSGLIGYGNVAGSGNTAYTSGNINGFGDGSAAVAGNGNSAYTTGTETGQNEGAFSGFGNFNSATADNNYTLDGHGVSATFGNCNYAFVNGPADSTAHAGGVADHLGNSNIAYVSDPFGTSADTATAGSSSGASGSNDLAEVLYTHGSASAQGGNFLYDIVSVFGNAHSAAATAAADPAAALPGAGNFDIGPTLSSEIASLNSMFESYAPLSGVDPTDIIKVPGGFDTIDPANTTPTFDTLLFGLNPANITTDPGSYDVLNGAIGQFDNAYNVGLFSLFDPTGTFDPADIIGTHAAFLHDGATVAIGEFLQQGFTDLLGYF